MVTTKEEAAIIALLGVARAVIETVEDMGSDGAPGELIYASLIGIMSHANFGGLMGGLVSTKRLVLIGNVYYAPHKVPNKTRTHKGKGR